MNPKEFIIAHIVGLNVLDIEQTHRLEQMLLPLNPRDADIAEAMADALETFYNDEKLMSAEFFAVAVNLRGRKFFASDSVENIKRIERQITNLGIFLPSIQFTIFDLIWSMMIELEKMEPEELVRLLIDTKNPKPSMSNILAGTLIAMLCQGNPKIPPNVRVISALTSSMLVNYMTASMQINSLSLLSSPNIVLGMERYLSSLVPKRTFVVGD